MRIAVIDGQGGGIGKYIISRIREELPLTLEIIALGTNALATSAMIKAGANDGATGENAICYMSTRVDIICGSLAILAVNSFLGEYTAPMAAAVAASPAQKLILPVNRLNICVVGANDNPLPHLTNILIKDISKILEDQSNV